MANYNIGPKIGIEGEKEFRQQLSRINKEYAAAESYIKALDKAMDQNGRSQEQLATKSNMLRQQIDLQQKKFEELYKALSKAKEKYGDNSQEVLRFEGAILDVRNTTADLERQLRETDDQMDKLARGIDDAADAAEDGEPKVLDFGDALKAGIASGAILEVAEEVAEAVVDIGKAVVEASAEVRAEEAQFEQAFKGMESTARGVLQGISADAGISTTRLQGLASGLYAYVKGIGGDSETALGVMNRALRAAADSAAYYDMSMEDATERLKSFLKGNYENGDALGVAATETTRNAKANEMYATSFKDLEESQKVDVLLSMVEASNAASGALGQAAREADSWANVQGEFNEALRQTMAWLGSPILEGIIPLIKGATNGLRELVTQAEWQSLSKGIEAFREGLEAADTALANSNTNIAATAGLAQQYTQKLQALEDAGLNTADAQREYAQVVELLNALYPDLNLYIDKNTGLLNKNTDELAVNVEALKAQAEAQAKQAYFAAIVEQLTAVQKERYAAEMRLAELEAQQAELLRQGAQAVDLYAAAEAEAAGRGAEFWASLSEQDRALYEVQREIQATNGELQELDAELEKHEKKLDNATAAYGRMEQAAKDAGYATAQGLAEGIRNGGYLVEGAMKDMAKKAQVAYNRTMEIHSPSRVMARAGAYTVAGAVEGVEENIRSMEAAMRDLAKSGNAAYLQEQLDYAAQYPSMVAGAAGYGGGSSTTTNNYSRGPVSITINAANGQSAREIANEVMALLSDEAEMEGASLYG